ncbi:hypothetical protein Y032_0004g1887 [Ancylostoma ceylanicum]|uniref:Uncharacterized protein n=1 Tax=Ancylostoma ceylanicum TaxID=53326 RepID=A0A016VUB4_9BILA|nr:hypothetical protein Y032_0004g1887 [Ancylostoma ceylanicum]
MKWSASINPIMWCAPRIRLHVNIAEALDATTDSYDVVVDVGTFVHSQGSAPVLISGTRMQGKRSEPQNNPEIPALARRSGWLY